MRSLLASHVSRRLLASSAVGALADWTLFAALVAFVDARTGASAFAVALVTAARVVPALVLGPLLAPFAGAWGVRRTLVAADVLRAAAVVAVPFAGSAVELVAVLVVLELGGALGSATREAAISAGIDPRAYRTMNTVTAILGYGMLPVGGVLSVAALAVDPRAPFALAAVGYLIDAAVLAPLRALDGAARRQGARVRPTDGLRRVVARGPLRDTVVAATLGVVAIAALFGSGAAFADDVLGGVQRYGWLQAVLGAGAGLGALAAQRGATATPGLVLATAGSLALLGPVSVAVAGLALVGAGAGVAFVATQSRLQAVATGAAEFAAASAVLKAGVLGAVLAGAHLADAFGTPAVAVAMAVATAAAAARTARVDAPHASALLAVARRVLGWACRIRVVGQLPPGPCVLASNHPSLLDGPLAVWLDGRVRPVAKPQRHPLARLGFRLSGALVTGRGSVVDVAVDHLVAGGLVWLAPEGRCNDGPLGRPRTGVVRIAAAAGVAVVPLAIVYPDGRPRLRAWRPWRRPRVELRLGAPLRFGLDADPAVASEEVMAAIAVELGVPHAGALVTAVAG
jgi:1-acyl-sn-glycerol-3-phosphate acyltransferase